MSPENLCKRTPFPVPVPVRFPFPGQHRLVENPYRLAALIVFSITGPYSGPSCTDRPCRLVVPFAFFFLFFFLVFIAPRHPPGTARRVLRLHLFLQLNEGLGVRVCACVLGPVILICLPVELAKQTAAQLSWDRNV